MRSPEDHSLGKHTKYKILIGGECVTRIQMMETDRERVQDLLKSVYDGPQPTCLCRVDGVPVDMTVRMMGDEERYVLARRAGSRMKHEVGCFYRTSSLSQSDDRIYRPGIRKNPNGHIQISVDVNFSPGIEKSEPPEVSIPGRYRGGGNSEKRAKTTLVGMGNHFFEETELNCWSPGMMGKRNWQTLKRRIERYAETKQVSLNGERLVDLLYIPSLPNEGRRSEQIYEFADFMERRIRVAGNPNGCALIIGVLEGIDRTDEYIDLRISQMSNFNFIISENYYKSLRDRFCKHAVLFDHDPENITDLQNNGDRAVGLFVVENSFLAPDVYMVKEFGVIRTTNHWIPVDSHPESSVAWRLVTEYRHFVKPMSPNADGYIHDFLALDAGSMPMEVFGVHGDVDYDRRKKEKLEYLNNSGKPYWTWPVIKGKDNPEDCPDLPPKTRRD